MAQAEIKRSARNAAMNLLSRREHSFKELMIKLQQREFSGQEIETALKQLQVDNLLNDERFAESYIHHRIQKGFGPMRIMQELSQRGVSQETIQTQMECKQEDWSKMMQHQRSRKYGEKIPEDYSERMKQARFLQNRGFSTESVMRLFR